MFYVADRGQNDLSKIVLIANYFLELSGKHTNCCSNELQYKWFKEIIIKRSNIIRVVCRTSIYIPWEEGEFLIPIANSESPWVYFNFDTMRFDITNNMKDYYNNALTYWGNHYGNA